MSRKQLHFPPDLSRLPATDRHGVIQAVIETPRGSRNKLTYDDTRQVMTLRKILPAGMVFPHNFVFVPSTLAGDGEFDPFKD